MSAKPGDRVTHICVSRQTITGSDNGLSPGRHRAIIWTNAGKLLFGPPGTNFSEILIEILTFSFKKMQLKMSSAKRRPFCLGLNVLMITTEAQPHPGNYFHGTLFPEFAYTVKPVCNDHLYNKIYQNWAELLWHMLNCDLIRATRQGRATRFFIQKLDYELIWTFLWKYSLILKLMVLITV